MGYLKINGKKFTQILEKTFNTNNCTFLDLEINIENDRFVFRSFDKRKNFPFDIVYYPDLHSNIPHIPSYGVYHSQLVRFCDLNGTIENFKNDIVTLTNKFKENNYKFMELEASFKRFCLVNLIRWAKFGIDIADLLKVA